MFERKNNELVNEEKELNAIIDFVISRWEGLPKDKFAEVIQIIWGQSRQIMPYFIEDYSNQDFMFNWLDERQNEETWKKNHAVNSVTQSETYDDVIVQQLSVLIQKTRIISEYLRKDFNYETSTSAIQQIIEEKYPQSIHVKPIGLDNILEDYDDFEAMEKYTQSQGKQDIEEFKGSYSLSDRTHFYQQINAPNTAYAYKNHHRTPWFNLVFSIMTQALMVQRHNESVMMLEDLTKLKEKYNTPEYYQDIQFEIDFEPEINHPILKVILALNKRKAPLVTKKKGIANLKKNRKDYKQLNSKEDIQWDEETLKVLKDIVSDSFKISPEKQKELDKKKQNEEEFVMSYLKEYSKNKSKND